MVSSLTLLELLIFLTFSDVSSGSLHTASDAEKKEDLFYDTS